MAKSRACVLIKVNVESPKHTQEELEKLLDDKISIFCSDLEQEETFPYLVEGKVTKI